LRKTVFFQNADKQSEANLESRGGTQAGENESADVHAVLGNASEATEHTQRERPVPRAARVVDYLNLPEQLVWFRDVRAGQGAASPVGEETPDDAGPEGDVGGPELGGEAEKHGLGEDARLLRQDAERKGHGSRNCWRSEELAEARAGGVESVDSRGGGQTGAEMSERNSGRRKRSGGLEVTVVTGAEAPVEFDAPFHGRSRWDLPHRRRWPEGGNGSSEAGQSDECHCTRVLGVGGPVVGLRNE
jgi:hypothetical protein